jgi:hypothetical protein
MIYAIARLNILAADIRRQHADDNLFWPGRPAQTKSSSLSGISDDIIIDNNLTIEY